MKNFNGASIVMNLLAIPALTILNIYVGYAFVAVLILSIGWNRKGKRK